MNGSFEYFYEKRVNAQLDIENTGNCAIEANDDLGNCYYLIIKTQLGQTIILEAGPYIPDLNILEKSCSICYSRIEYDERKINKVINSFLNNPYRMITQAQEIGEQEVYKNCINILDYVAQNKDFNEV